MNAVSWPKVRVRSNVFPFDRALPVPSTSYAHLLTAIATDQKKSKAKDVAKRAPSPDEVPARVVVNMLDEVPKEGFNKGKALVDNPAMTSCKWCKKSILLTTAVEHINGCLKVKKEKANRKKAAREARERAKEQAIREEARRRAEEEGITLGGDGDSGDDDDGDDDKGPAGKSTRKFAGKKSGDGDTKGKKRKAEGDLDKGPKQKKKKDEPKPKTKPKGELISDCCCCAGGRLFGPTIDNPHTTYLHSTTSQKFGLFGHCILHVDFPTTVPSTQPRRWPPNSQVLQGLREQASLTSASSQALLMLRDSVVSCCLMDSPAPGL